MTDRLIDTPDRRLPRGHAYVRVRNRGYSIHIDFTELDSAIAEKMIKAAMDVYREETESESAK